MLTRHQIYTLLIAISAGLMLGRIAAVNRTDLQGLQKYRFDAVQKRFNEREEQLHSANAPEEEFIKLAEEWPQRLDNEKRELPVFSSNDRSRWNTIRVLVEPDMRVQRTVKLPDGTERTETVWYAIDKAQNVKGWDTIDMVKHNNIASELSFGEIVKKDGSEMIEKAKKAWETIRVQLFSDQQAEEAQEPEENAEYVPPVPSDAAPSGDEQSDQMTPGYLYSSKPPLLPTLMAIPYAAMYWGSNGKLSLEQEPFLVVRAMLVICNFLPLVFCWFLLSRLIDRFGTTDWGRVFSMAFVCFGTFLSTFVITLNNHLPGVVSVAIAFYCVVRIVYDKKIQWYYFAIAGFFGAFAVACEMPALLLCCLFGLWLLYHQWRRTLFIFAPAALLVAAAFFTTNYMAHKTPFPAYSHQDWYFYKYERGTDSAGQPVIRDSYWKNPAGVDRGEPDLEKYVFHTTVGHHGLFSLTPVWALSLLGLLCWLVDRRYWSMSLIILLTSLVVFAFYMAVPLHLRNYGGMTSAFRWLFWLAPLWAVALVAAADLFSKHVFFRAIALVCLIVSALSAAYPIWNPWTMPWTYNLLQYIQ